MKTVSIHEAKTHLSGIISEIERFNERVVICRHGRAVAELLPYKHQRRNVVDPLLSKIKINCDLTESTEMEWDNA